MSRLRTKRSLWLAAIIGFVQALSYSDILAVERIKLLHEGGVYKVPALINEQLVKLFILDSGSAEVQVPAEVFLSLFPETVGPEDFLPGSGTSWQTGASSRASASGSAP